MASSFAEKAQVAAVTATLVSAGWIVVGAFVLDREEAARIDEEISIKQVATSPETASPDGQDEDITRDSGGAFTPLEAETSNLMIPVLGVSARDLTDTFTDKRGEGTRLHEALDIPADAGTSVIAAAPGTVERLFRSNAGGNTIYVRSEDRQTIYYYAHLDEYAPGLNEGQRVRRGQRLGTVGSSGNAEPDAPHLHFEVMRTTPEAEWWEPATSVNPYPLLVRR